MAKKKREKPTPISPSRGRQAWLIQRERPIVLGLLLVYLLCSAVLFDPKPFVGGDNAVYVILSQSLARGRGMAELWTPEQRPHTQYPPGFPLMLAPISLLKLPYFWYKLVPWLAGLAGILLTWLLLRKQDQALALATALLLAVNPHYLEFGHWVLSELPFLAMGLLCLWLLGRWRESGENLWWFLGSCLAAASCVSIRSAGIAIVLAVAIHLAARRRFKLALLFLGINLLLMFPWSLRNAHFGTSGGYLDQFLMRDPYQPELGRADFMEITMRAWTNLKLYLGSIWPQMMAPGSVASVPSPLWWLLFPTISLPILIGSVSAIREDRAEGWLALCYLGLSMLWPVAWTDLRFSLPLLPINLWLLFAGYRRLAARLFKRNKTAVPAIVFLCLLVLSLASIGMRAGPNLTMLKDYFRGDKLSGYDPQWKSFFRAAVWVKDNSPQESIVVSRKPQLFHLISGRRSFCYPFTADADSMVKTLVRADYVMVEPVSGTVQRYLIPAVQPLINQRFRMIHAVGNPPTYVLQVIKEKGYVP